MKTHIKMNLAKLTWTHMKWGHKWIYIDIVPYFELLISFYGHSEGDGGLLVQFDKVIDGPFVSDCIQFHVGTAPGLVNQGRALQDTVKDRILLFMFHNIMTSLLPCVTIQDFLKSNDKLC